MSNDWSNVVVVVVGGAPGEVRRLEARYLWSDWLWLGGQGGLIVQFTWRKTILALRNRGLINRMRFSLIKRLWH